MILPSSSFFRSASPCWSSLRRWIRPASSAGRLRPAFASPPDYSRWLARLGRAVASLDAVPWSPPGSGCSALSLLVDRGRARARLTRDHARATDLYLFPIGLLFTMAAMLSAWIALRQGAEIELERIEEGGVALNVLLFPTMAGLAARARIGYARLLMILAFVYVFAIGSAPGDDRDVRGPHRDVVCALRHQAHDARLGYGRRRRHRAGAGDRAGGGAARAAGDARQAADAAAALPSLAYAFNVVAARLGAAHHGHGFRDRARGVVSARCPPRRRAPRFFRSGTSLAWWGHG